MKKILWLAAGGTISCVKGEKGLAPDVTEEQMRKMLESLGDVPANVHMKIAMNIDSSDISCEDIKKLGTAADDGILSGFQGIVITHGTDTMAYTSAVLAKMLENPPVPIIMTGSQIPFFEENSDGRDNLSNAFFAACNERFRGVHILFGNKVIAGGKAYKAYTQNKNAFISPDGYTGIISEGIITPAAVENTGGSYRFHPDINEKVILIKLTPCTRPDVIEFAVRSGYRGIVIEGYGCGGIPERLLSEIKKAADKGIKIMLISQCFYDGVFMDIYEVGEKAAECGIISGGKMTAEAAVAQMMFEIFNG